MWITRVWARAPWSRYRPLAWLVAIGLMAGAVWRVETTAHRAIDAASAARAAGQLNAAGICVSAWNTHLGVNGLVDGMTAAAANSDPPTDPARVEAFREDMGRRNPQPECDRVAAQRVIDEAEDREGS